MSSARDDGIKRLKRIIRDTVDAALDAAWEGRSVRGIRTFKHKGKLVDFKVDIDIYDDRDD